jgi:putative ABC transport system permease protein
MKQNDGLAGGSIPFLIAWRNLTHDRGRFAVALIGIAFSVILMGAQIGLLLNFISTTSTIASHSDADIFITAPGVRSADISTPQKERRRFQAMSVPGVARAEVIALDFSQWKRPDGVMEAISLVGVAPNATMELPWNLQHNADPHELLGEPDGVIIDRLYAHELGVKRIGQLAEINNVRVRVVGMTSGIRTFTQSPFIFTSLSGARRMVGAGDRHISYVLIKVAKGYSVNDVRDRLQRRLPDTQVITAVDFARSSARYWLFTTGAGISLIMSAVLGLLIGGVIVAQTLYASTLDRLPEYATLRAIGGPARYLYRIVLTQATLEGLMGYAIGFVVVGFVVWSGRNASAAPEMPLWLAVAIGLATLGDCWLAAAVSLRVITRIDPVKVFR